MCYNIIELDFIKNYFMDWGEVYIFIVNFVMLNVVLVDEGNLRNRE